MFTTKILASSDPWHSREPIWIWQDSAALATVVLLHGRGGGAERMITWAHELMPAANLFAPQATEQTWYPYSFLRPTYENQPYLDSALLHLGSVIELAMHETEASPRNVILLGFSQGACLLAEYLKRHPARYGGAVIMSGGVIGDDTEVSGGVEQGLDSMPVYLGCDAHDPHIPFDRLELTAQQLGMAGASMIMATYADFGHRPHPDATRFARGLVAEMYNAD